VSKEWLALAGDGSKASTTPSKTWSKTGVTGKDYESFSSVAYAADLFIPLINFGQEDAWAPSTNRGNWGWHLWWFKWLVKASGWIVTAMGAAAITGFIRND